jgi:hypothetical protein
LQSLFPDFALPLASPYRLLRLKVGAARVAPLVSPGQ